jgi:hypothetical protein
MWSLRRRLGDERQISLEVWGSSCWGGVIAGSRYSLETKFSSSVGHRERTQYIHITKVTAHRFGAFDVLLDVGLIVVVVLCPSMSLVMLFSWHSVYCG